MTDTVWLGQAVAAFRDTYGHAPQYGAWSPGRVNLIGEHTDYNQGLVLPCALPQGTFLLAAKNDSAQLRIRSLTLGESATLDLCQPSRSAECPWMDYPAGVASELGQLGWSLPGADCLVDSNVPLGAGLSSSASFEMAFLSLFEQLCGKTLDDASAALLGQRVENRFLGLSSGVMDQFAVRAAREGQALLLDCRSLAYELLPAQLPDCVFVVANTASPRRLTGSEYNQRVSECKEALRLLQRFRNPGGTALREYDEMDLAAAREHMPPLIYSRARHVVSENARVLEAASALQQGGAEAFGALMNASHQSLRDDYSVSSPALEAMVQSLVEQTGCLGARLTGAGFGGCCVALFRESGAEAQLAKAMGRYQDLTGTLPHGFLMQPAKGSHPVHLDCH